MKSRVGRFILNGLGGTRRKFGLPISADGSKVMFRPLSAVLMVVPVLYLLSITSFGLGFSWDSGHYAALSQDIFFGGSPKGDGSYPYALPFFVGTLNIIFGDIELAFSIVNALGLFVSGLAAKDIVSNSSTSNALPMVGALGLQLIIAANVVAFFAWTEVLFAAILLLCISFALRAVESQSISFSLTLALSVLPLIRYQGVYVSAALVLAVLLYGLRRSSLRKLRRQAMQLSLSFLPFLLVAVVNQYLFGYPFGPREASPRSIVSNVLDFISAVAFSLQGPVSLVFLIFGTVWVLNHFLRQKKNGRETDLTAVLLLCILAVVASQLYASSTVYIEPIGPRYVFPVVVLTYLYLIMSAMRYLESNTKSIKLPILTGILVTSLLIAQVAYSWSEKLSVQASSETYSNNAGYKLNPHLKNVRLFLEALEPKTVKIYYVSFENARANAMAVLNRYYLFSNCSFDVQNQARDKYQGICRDGSQLKVLTVEVVSQLPHSTNEGAVGILDLRNMSSDSQVPSAWKTALDSGSFRVLLFDVP
jgi:hypothetical protein